MKSINLFLCTDEKKSPSPLWDLYLPPVNYDTPDRRSSLISPYVPPLPSPPLLLSSPLPPPSEPPTCGRGFNLNNFSIYLLGTQRCGTKIKQRKEEIEQIVADVLRSRGFIALCRA